MMYSKDIRMSIKTTNFTFFKHVPFYHVLSDSGKLCFPNGFFGFIDTLFATVFSISTRGILKLFFAMITAICFNFIIMRFFTSNLLQSCGLSFRFSKMPKTFARTAFSNFSPIRQNLESLRTYNTYYGYHNAS